MGGVGIKEAATVCADPHYIAAVFQNGQDEIIADAARVFRFMAVMDELIELRVEDVESVVGGYP